MRSDHELKKLAVEYVNGTLIPSWDIPKDLERIVYMPLALMNEEQLKKLVDKKVTYLFGQLKNAGPRAINGYPMFTAFGTLTKEEGEKLLEFAKDYHERTKEFTGE